MLSAPSPAGVDPNAAAPAQDVAAKADAATAFNNALAQASGTQAPGNQASGAQASDLAATSGVGGKDAVAKGAAARDGTSNATPQLASGSTDSVAQGLGAQGFSALAVSPVTPATYTASGVTPQAVADTSAQVPAADPSASTMSQTAVQTLSALSMQISKRLDDGNTRFDVELHPADLGRVDVSMTIDRDGTVNAHLNFDTPITAAAFGTHEAELRQQLSQAGVNVEGGSLTFSSRHDGDNGAASSGGGQNGFANSHSNSGQSSSGQSSSGQSSSGQSHSNSPSAAEAARALAAAGQTNDAADLNLSSLGSQGSSLALNLIV